MALKTLNILGDSGAGKKTLAGHLLLKCGAGLREMELIEKNKVGEYRGIADLFRQHGRPMTFFGPSSHYIIQDENAPSSHVVLWVVDATAADQGKSSSERLRSLLSSGELQVEEQLVVAVNKMDLKSWSAQSFSETARLFSDMASRDLRLTRPRPPGRVSVVPLSALHGSNLLEPPEQSPPTPSLSPAEQDTPPLAAAQALVSLF